MSVAPTGFLLQHINELSMKLDVEGILQKAEGICFQIQNCKVLSVCCFWGARLKELAEGSFPIN